MRPRRFGTELVHERGSHPPCAGPRRVRGADRLHDILEDGRRPQHPARAVCAPGQIRVVARDEVEAGEVLVEAEHVPDGSSELVADARRRAPGGEVDAQSTAAFAQAYGSRASGDGECRLQLACPEVDAVRRKLGDAVGDDRACEVDRLSAGAPKP